MAGAQQDTIQNAWWIFFIYKEILFGMYYYDYIKLKEATGVIGRQTKQSKQITKTFENLLSKNEVI